MNLVVDVVEENNKSNVILSGEIDAYTAPKLKDALLPLTKINGKTVEVDLDQVGYMDSTGLGVFISALKSTKEFDSHLRLINLQDRVLRLFKITGLDEIMEISDGIRGGQ
ncbi:STAS domain-containing protein [Virgibacillus necropolis]|uniref:Anti-sigma factor antagonist n=1 Tax=Virgibacillus necropolis TaxID=163877 RepID=A0A221MHH2_9BACI|nr:STAS domain-containing protein [Virgibacillus necropolis]ASN07081.1 anti-anti-sigma factor [Virgibacillus necropolis]